MVEVVALLLTVTADGLVWVSAIRTSLTLPPSAAALLSIKNRANNWPVFLSLSLSSRCTFLVWSANSTMQLMWPCSMNSASSSVRVAKSTFLLAEGPASPTPVEVESLVATFCVPWGTTVSDVLILQRSEASLETPDPCLLRSSGDESSGPAPLEPAFTPAPPTTNDP